MKIALDQIKIDENTRIREDVGDLKSLEASINKVGLINPILIDEQSNLLAGFRRFTACKNLGMQEIEATIINIDNDMLKVLDIEVAENFYRKDFTPDEILSAERRRLEIIESKREKGVLERVWLGIKGLFRPQPIEKKPVPPPPQEDQSTQPSESAENPSQS